MQSLPIMKTVTAACLGILAITASGCQEPPAARGTPVYAVDINGRAKSCTVSTVDLSDGKPATATMTLGNDGGWCGVTVAQSGKKPFAAGLVQTRAQHGQLNVHSVGDNTRVDYIPDPGFTGADQFAVRLLPGNPVLSVNVTVTK